MDFTPQKYKELIATFIKKGYECISYETYCEAKQQDKTLPEKFVILRHDVDLEAKRSAVIAQIEHELGAKAVYYFRFIPESNQPEIIQQIIALGHEVGYHYEDMTVCQGDDTAAYTHFCKWLAYFRTFYPVKTVCMHGSPRSKYDAKDLWRNHTLSGIGIIGEPYLTTDFNDVLYLTDTGRCWDGAKYSVRDKVDQATSLSFHTTNDIINTLNDVVSPMPNHIMITTHPQRWIGQKLPWLLEWIKQNVKNQIKRLLIRS
ncbi:MAG: hypothetical protein Q4D14_01640 [Bacteroidales bacterium]|nr:hypothetical protein [Bacteroidales bacterium]